MVSLDQETYTTQIIYMPRRLTKNKPHPIEAHAAQLNQRQPAKMGATRPALTHRAWNFIFLHKIGDWGIASLHCYCLQFDVLFTHMCSAPTFSFVCFEGLVGSRTNSAISVLLSELERDCCVSFFKLSKNISSSLSDLAIKM